MEAPTLQPTHPGEVHPARVDRRLEVTGIVQGVGFRPFVHRLATELGLDGVVGNDSARVFIEFAGPLPVLDAFAERLVTDAPPLAVIEAVTDAVPSIEHAAQRDGGVGFRIVASEQVGGDRTFVSPDVAVCDDCLAEMRDPADRRFGHPFITCTNCGPRFTITRTLPYDRPNTTMAGFEMCDRCRAEYDDPSDRRFHAQPIGCHDCGPRLSFHLAGDDLSADAGDRSADAALDRARETLADHRTLAIKGLGGFHLAALATSDRAVQRLRHRKHRPDKPFAVMVADVAAAATLAHLSDREADLLASPARPIVLCRARGDSPLSDLVAPGNPLIGLLLPYTPVHHRLFESDLGPIVMTSGNAAGEPLCYRDEGLAGRLGPMVDAYLTNDRPIHLPCDDSVVRVVGSDVLPIRRSRGFAPMPIALALPLTSPDLVSHDVTVPPVLAVGGELKNSFCLTSGNHAWMSQHIGDMENLETLQAFAASVEQFGEFYGVEPGIVAADTHPGYLSSGWARANHGDHLIEVQHHHAHVAAVMAEHGLDPFAPVLGLAFDGTGDGTDGTVWGGELLVATATEAHRIAHLRHVPLPGGDEAVRHPWRVALAHLREAGLPWEPDLPPVAQAGDGELALLRQQLDGRYGCVPTSSMGRFFDAVSSLLGLRHQITYEAQAAIELEIAASSWAGPVPVYPFDLDDPTPMLAAICADVRASVPVGAMARGFHLAVADGVASLVTAEAARLGITTVVLTGGVFQNVFLVELISRRLRRADLQPLTHRLVPPNDGGLALGQAFVAVNRSLVRGRSPEPRAAHVSKE